MNIKRINVGKDYAIALHFPTSIIDIPDSTITYIEHKLSTGANTGIVVIQGNYDWKAINWERIRREV